MLKKMLELFRLYFVLGVVGEGSEEVDEPEIEAPEEDDAPADDLDSLVETVETDTEVEEEERPRNSTRELRKRAQESEEARIRAEATLEAERRLRSEQSRSQTVDEESRLFMEEEKRLRDAEVSDIEKWQINSNRTLRANSRAATQALRSATDISDRAEFDRLAVTNPKVYKAYSDRVEKSLSEMRTKGQDAPRLAVLRFLIGDDAVNGKTTGETVRKKTSTPVSTVNRSKPASARSDVSSKQKQSERDKRNERLRNQNI